MTTNVNEKKLDITSKKSLRDHGIEYTADGFRLVNADVLVKNAGNDLLNWLIEKKIVKKDDSQNR